MTEGEGDADNVLEGEDVDDGVAELVGEEVPVAVAVAVTDGDEVTVPLGEAVVDGVEEVDAVPVGVAEGVCVTEAVLVGVEVWEGLDVWVTVPDGVLDTEAVGVKEGVELGVGVYEGVGDGVGATEGQTSNVVGLSISSGFQDDTFTPTKERAPPGAAGAGTLFVPDVRGKVAMPMAMPGTAVYPGGTGEGPRPPRAPTVPPATSPTNSTPLPNCRASCSGRSPGPAAEVSPEVPVDTSRQPISGSRQVRPSSPGLNFAQVVTRELGGAGIPNKNAEPVVELVNVAAPQSPGAPRIRSPTPSPVKSGVAVIVIPRWPSKSHCEGPQPKVRGAVSSTCKLRSRPARSKAVMYTSGSRMSMEEAAMIANSFRAPLPSWSYNWAADMPKLKNSVPASARGENSLTPHELFKYMSRAFPNPVANSPGVVTRASGFPSPSQSPTPSTA